MEYEALSRFFEKLDRSLFIDNDYKSYADLDAPLPIGFNQTISQPSLVFEMTYLLSTDKQCKVLEIGTGSGYQTALLAEFSDKVFTVERIRALSEKAQRRLDSLGYSNIFYKVGDGSEGWKENAPFDRIIVTAAAGKPPEELMKQLAPGGAMIVPIGPKIIQELNLITRDTAGNLKTETIGEVRFVEMKGKYGWN